MLRVLTRPRRVTPLIRLSLRPVAFQSKVIQDRQQLKEHTIPSDFAKGQFANQMPDYEVAFEDIVIRTQPLAQINVHVEHPLETGARANREKTDVFTNLQDNQVIMTNLPVDCQLKTKKDVKEFLLAKVHRDLDVKDVQIYYAVQMSQASERLAYIVVTLGSKRQAHMTKSTLRKEWLSDSLLKVKVNEDVKQEHFNNRTVLVREIPRYLRIEHVLDLFGTKYGAVTNIELPTEITPIKNIIMEQQQRVGTQIDDEKAASARQAEFQIKQSLAVDQEYRQFLTETLDEQTAAIVIADMQANPQLKAPEALDQERLSSVIRLITHLQAEGQRVQERKLDILHLKSVHSLADSTQPEASDQAASFVAENSDRLKRILGYLEKTRQNEAIVGSVEDQVARLLNLAKGELMYAYDELLNELDSREQLVSQRLSESIEYFDENEKILLEGKDWRKEQDDIGNPFTTQHEHIERIISVNQQIYDIYKFRNMSTKEKLQRLLMKELNPFVYGNFAPETVEAANSDLAREWKQYALPNLFVTKSAMREDIIKSQWKHFRQEQFEEMLARVKAETEPSFEEIYHREKQVIAGVIEAQKRLETRQEQMRNPMEHRILDEKLLTPEQRAEIQHLLDEQKPQFEQSMTREQQRVLNEQIEKLDKQLGMVGKYDFTQTDEQRWRAMVDAGELTNSDLQKLIQMRRENETQNLGYCFITFSHADEARVMLLLNKKPQFMEDKRLEFDLKSNIDHGDLDMRYTIQRSKNDASMLNEIEGLRQAKKNLREFEKGMDKMLPSTQKITKFKQKMMSMLENHEFDTREQNDGKISELDQARLDMKVKELEQKYPHINFSQLYASEQAEAAKQALHKKAYASYKAFQFLKNGVKTSKTDDKPRLSKAQQRLIDNDPYSFPMMDDTVHRLLSKEVSAPTAIDNGDRMSKPGRRTSLSAQDYLEMHYGKDMLRMPRQRIQEDDIFTFQETLKKKYPMNQFLKLEKTEKMIKRLEDLGLDYDYKKFPQLKLKNDEMQQLIDENEGHFFDTLYGEKRMTVQHPTDPKRDFTSDQERLMNDAVAKQNERDGGDINSGVFSKITSDLLKEYGIKQSANTEKWMNRVMDKMNTGQLRFQRKSKAHNLLAKDEKAEAKFEANYDKEREQMLKELGYGQQPLDQEQVRLNNEFFYRERVKPSPDDHLTQKVNEKAQSNYAKMPVEHKINNEPPEKIDVYKELKNEAFIQKGGTHFGGQFFRDHQLGVDRVEDRFSKNKSGKGLQDFYEGESEMDAYDEYRRRDGSKDSKHDEIDGLHDFRIEKDKLNPDMPRFDSYFKSKSKGVHPFDSIANSFEESELRTQDDDEFEQREEQALYKRELMGRLMGMKLTPRQFEVLTGQFSSLDTRTERVQAIGKQQFIDSRDSIRLMEEQIEKYRRQQVSKGAWSEAESRALLKQWLSNLVNESMGPGMRKKMDREYAALYEVMRTIENPEQLLEKEYHFDEGLGVSLADHMMTLRNQYPGATVLSRRDREGYAIIKVSFKPEYKFDIEVLSQFDKASAERKFMLSLEEILSRTTGGKGLNESHIDQVKLHEEIRRLASDPSMVPDLSSYAKMTIQHLVKERISGVYKDDQEGFVNEVQRLLLSEHESSANMVQSNALLDLDERKHSHKSSVDAIFEDRDRFRSDVSDQLRRRVIKYQNFTNRTESDFIKPRVNERESAEMQQTINDANITKLEEESVQMEANKNNQDFDKEAYYRLKQELKERKEAKERLLSQGLPQFKAYMRF